MDFKNPMLYILIIACVFTTLYIKDYFKEPVVRDDKLEQEVLKLKRRADSLELVGRFLESQATTQEAGIAVKKDEWKKKKKEVIPNSEKYDWIKKRLVSYQNNM